MKKGIQPLAESVLIPSGLTAAVSATDARMHKKTRLGNNKANNMKLKNDRHYENS